MARKTMRKSKRKAKKTRRMRGGDPHGPSKNGYSLKQQWARRNAAIEAWEARTPEEVAADNALEEKRREEARLANIARESTPEYIAAVKAANEEDAMINADYRTLLSEKTKQRANAIQKYKRNPLLPARLGPTPLTTVEETDNIAKVLKKKYPAIHQGTINGVIRRARGYSF